MNIIALMLVIFALIFGISFGMSNPPPRIIKGDRIEVCHPGERIKHFTVKGESIEVACDTGHGIYFRNSELEQGE